MECHFLVSLVYRYESTITFYLNYPTNLELGQ